MVKRKHVFIKETISRKSEKEISADQYLEVLSMKGTPVAVGILSGKDFIITFANPLFCLISGKEYKKIINKPLWNAMPEVQGQGFEELLNHVLETGIPYIGSESPVTLNRNGKLETGYFSFVFTPIRNGYGEFTQIMIIATEVTNKVLKEKAVQQEREHFYEIFMNAPAVIGVLKGPTHIIDMVNPLASQAIGIKRDVVGQSVRDAMPEVAAQGFIKILDQVYQSGKPFFGNEIETKIDVEGTGMLITFYYNFVFQPDIDLQGKTQGVFVYAVDVTEEVVSRRRIEENEKRLTNILESISDAFISYDKDWRFVYVNHEASNIIGKTHNDVIGKVVWDVFPELKSTEAGKQLLTVAKTGKTLFFQTYYPPFEKWFDVRFYPGKDGITTTFRDITKRKLLEKQKEEFLGIASHELKTPVTSLKSFAQVLENRFSRSGQEQSAMLLEKMNAQINKLAALVQDLLDVSKIESGKIQLHKERFKLSDLIEEIVEETQRTTDKHNIIFKQKKSIEIFADRDRIGQVLTNLIVNAIKYSTANSKIVVSCKLNEKEVIIRVKDFGIGISKEHLPNIFDRFFRVSDRKYNTVPGMGLGLNIASEIVKNHGGNIWATSKEEKGSAFYFSLPIISDKKSE